MVPCQIWKAQKIKVELWLYDATPTVVPTATPRKLPTLHFTTKKEQADRLLDGGSGVIRPNTICHGRLIRGHKHNNIAEHSSTSLDHRHSLKIGRPLRHCDSNSGIERIVVPPVSGSRRSPISSCSAITAAHYFCPLNTSTPAMLGCD